MRKIIILFFSIIAAVPAMAQSYSAKVSKDSVGILTNRVEVLKTSIKLLELKIKEADEEAEVEKLRLKLLEANDKSKESASKKNDQFKKETLDAKTLEKLGKAAKNDAGDAQKANDKFSKQIAKVEDIRTQIQGEERKLGYKKPQIIYDYK
jgi:LPS O-antigen subunit length determinant protein (WzzB/FepE family)